MFPSFRCLGRRCCCCCCKQIECQSENAGNLQSGAADSSARILRWSAANQPAHSTSSVHATSRRTGPPTMKRDAVRAAAHRPRHLFGTPTWLEPERRFDSSFCHQGGILQGGLYWVVRRLRAIIDVFTRIRAASSTRRTVCSRRVPQFTVCEYPVTQRSQRM